MQDAINTYSKADTLAMAFTLDEDIQLDIMACVIDVKFRLTYTPIDLKANIDEEFNNAHDAYISFVQLMMVKFDFSQDMYILIGKDGSHNYSSAKEYFKVFMSKDANIVRFNEETNRIINLLNKDSVVYTKYGAIRKR